MAGGDSGDSVVYVEPAAHAQPELHGWAAFCETWRSAVLESIDALRKRAECVRIHRGAGGNLTAASNGNVSMLLCFMGGTLKTEYVNWLHANTLYGQEILVRKRQLVVSMHCGPHARTWKAYADITREIVYPDCGVRVAKRKGKERSEICDTVHPVQTIVDSAVQRDTGSNPLDQCCICNRVAGDDLSTCPV